jgi:hypothetical protein
MSRGVVAHRARRATRLANLRAALALVAALTLFVVAPAARAATTGVEKGISFTGYSAGSYVGTDATSSLSQLRDAGADWVMFLVTVYQHDIGSTTIYRDSPATPTDDSLRAVIAEAHDLGLSVMLKPQLGLTDDAYHWSSQIGRHFSAAQWKAWFAEYDRMIVHYASLAAATGAEQLCVGCELDAAARHAAQWRRVIADVRDVYGGLLTYADARLDRHPRAVTWWDAVDLIGVDAYPTLTIKTHPRIRDLVHGWRRYYPALRAVHERWHKPVIFTEIGVRSVVGGAAFPWDWRIDGAPDPLMQARWYRAALRTFGRRPWMKGIFWWQWYPDPSVGGMRDTSFTPHRKPAEDVLRTWYTQLLQ